MPTPIAQADVSAYWSFDGDFLADSTGHGNTLTNVNGAVSGVGIIGDGAVLDADLSQLLTIASNAYVAPVGSFSVSLWFYNDPAGYTDSDLIRAMTGVSSGFNIALVDPSGVDFNVYPANSSIFANGTWSFGAWTFVVCSWDASTGTMRIRLNANAATTQTGASYDPSPGVVRIGGQGGTFKGTLDEIAVYNRVLTSDEEDWLWNSGSGRTWSDYAGDEPESVSAGFSFPQATNIFTPSVSGYQLPRGEFPPITEKAKKDSKQKKEAKQKEAMNRKTACLWLILEGDD